MNKYDIHHGQILWLDNRKTGRLLVKVKKINPKNVKVVTEAGVVWNCAPVFLSPAPGETFTPLTSSAAPAGRAPSLCTGMAVRFLKGGEPGLFVVIGQHSGLWRVTKLGGDGGRYWPGIAAENLEVVNLNIEVGV